MLWKKWNIWKNILWIEIKIETLLKNRKAPKIASENNIPWLLALAQSPQTRLNYTIMAEKKSAQGFFQNWN